MPKNAGIGNDTLIGGAGNDTLTGGAGVDQASYALSAAGVAINLELGLASGGDAAGDTLSGIEDLKGSEFGDIPPPQHLKAASGAQNLPLFGEEYGGNAA